MFSKHAERNIQVCSVIRCQCTRQLCCVLMSSCILQFVKCATSPI